MNYNEDTNHDTKMDALSAACEKAAHTGEKQFVYLWADSGQRGYYVSNSKDAFDCSPTTNQIVAEIHQEIM